VRSVPFGEIQSDRWPSFFISRLFSQTLLLSLTLSLSTQECFSAGDKFPFLHLPCVFDVWHPGALTADLGKWVRESKMAAGGPSGVILVMSEDWVSK